MTAGAILRLVNCSRRKGAVGELYFRSFGPLALLQDL